MTQTTLTGIAAIEYAEANELTLCKSNDPIEEAREGLTPDEARKIAREDPRLIYVQLLKMTTYNLHTEAGEKLNGTAYATREEMLDAVRSVHGDGCDFAITEGAILDENEELVATFGEN